jgi:hypothetical protein
MSLGLFLVLLSGLAWMIVYIDSIRIGFKDQTYAMPFWALAFNFAWESLHTVLDYRELGFSVQIVINAFWTLLDVGILYTYFRFGRKYYPANLRPHWFYIWSALGLVTAFLLQILFIEEFGLMLGVTYSAFLQNLLMSILFIVMLAQRGSRAGQTLLIAVSKWIGTLAPTLLFGVLGMTGGGMLADPMPFVLVIGILISVFDLIYIGMLANTRSS